MSHTLTGGDADDAQTDARDAAREDTLDAYFTVLSNQRRRLALDCLQEYETPIALADLADEVAVREYDSPVTEIPAEEVKEIYVSLYHVHVPRLEDAGLAEYDQDDDLVTLLEDGQELIEAVP
ncbi:DUF7344 domain-containing protein [Halomicrobium salinisoli]|uniref:DUF7344 domain-containing protein n=1 Tax=Halomicrobium salinisoli TaxID=2878391 RepID=UPI001CF0CA34|nr:hypothetical protein [Halomicrobium salinisoli]